MKPLKKIATLLLAAALAVGVCIPAFATGGTTTTNPGTITIDNPKEGVTYTAYKIFDVVYDTKTVNGETVAGDHYSYTIKNNSGWFSTVQDYANTENSGLTLKASASDSTVYVVETTDAFSAPAFAAALKSALNTMTTKPAGTELTRTGNTGPASASNLPLGYYFVTSSTGALANLTTTEPDVIIHDKNDVPFDKTDDQGSVDVGQTVNYTITGKVPDTTGFTTYTYKVTDKMTKGLTPILTVDTDEKIATGVSIKVGDADNTSDWTIEPIYGLYDENGAPTTKDSNGDSVTKDTAGAAVVGFTATINLVSNGIAKYTVGQTITITYSATVNENAVAKIEKNSATLTYSNDPASGESTDTTPSDEETVYSAKIKINKYDANATNTKLADAKFVLYKEVTIGEGDAAVTTKQYYKWNDANKKVEWVALTEGQTVAQEITNGAITAQTTDTNGAASFDGLADGTYYLLETEAPAGYNLLENPVEVKVNPMTNDEGNSIELVESNLTKTVDVANETGTKLPSTGGIGRTIFLVAGLVLIVGAGVALVVRRRANKR